MMWEAIKGLGKNSIFWRERTCITDASLKRKIPYTVTNESKNDAETPPGLLVKRSENLHRLATINLTILIEK
jgi:hypothetical protein